MPKQSAKSDLLYMNKHERCKVDINNNFHFFLFLFMSFVYILKLNSLSAQFFFASGLLNAWQRTHCLLFICLIFIRNLPLFYALLIYSTLFFKRYVHLIQDTYCHAKGSFFSFWFFGWIIYANDFLCVLALKKCGCGLQSSSQVIVCVCVQCMLA